MKAVVVYVKGHEVSEQHKDRLVKSLCEHDWDYSLMEGLTPDTVDKFPYKYKDLPGGRLESFATNEPNKYPIKKACVLNHVRFAIRVLYEHKPMILLEHDQLVCAPPPKISFDEFCVLNMDHAFKPPSVLANYPAFTSWDSKYQRPSGIYDIPDTYPLQYYKHSKYRTSLMTPGTGAYALTPKGAKKFMQAVEQHGLEQSDFLFNSFVVKLQAVHPSPVKFQPTNPNLSHGL